MEQNLKVAYILHRFPYLTETFIMREMYWIRKHGININIFSLLPPKHALVHEQATELLAYTHYSHLLSWEVVKAQFHFLKRSPARYLRAFGRSLWQTYREPRVFLMAIALFPKSVYFAQEIERLGIEHIHAHFVWLGALAAGVASDLLGITFSIHPHAFDLFGRNQRNVRCELQNATQIITISDYNRNYIAELCPEIARQGIEIVHCGIDTEHFLPNPNLGRRTPIQILSVGRLVEKKGHEYLIEACALLAKKGFTFQCRIVGAGPRQEALQARIIEHGIQDKVTLLGALEQEQILQLYQTSDLFALACVRAKDGDQDGIPVSLMEAMACELPVIATPVTGIPELVRDGETGLLVEDQNAPALAEAIEKLIRDQELCQRLGAQARQVIVNEFQIEPNVAKMAEVFRRIRHQYS